MGTNTNSTLNNLPNAWSGSSGLPNGNAYTSSSNFPTTTNWLHHPVFGPNSGATTGTTTNNGGGGYGTSTSAPSGKSAGTNPYTSGSDSSWVNPLTEPMNNAIGASSSVANMFGGMLPQIGGAFSQLFSSNATDIESNLLKQAASAATNQLAGKYGDIPGHSSFSTELGEQMSNAGAQLAQSRTSQILPGLQTAAGTYLQASQMPLTTATNALQQGQSTSLSPLQSIMGVYEGAPYSPAVYQSGGGGGKK